MQQIIVSAITAGCLALLCLAILATPRRVNVQANSWLGVFLFAFASVQLDGALFRTGIYLQYPLLEGIFEIPRFAMTPALYFSVIAFTVPDRKFKRNDILHFIPFFLFLAYILVLVFHLDKTKIFSWYPVLPDVIRNGVAITVFAFLKVQMIIYWILAYWQLHRHSRNIARFASALDPISLGWLRYFLFGLAAALFLSLNEVLLIVPAIIPLTQFGYLCLTFYLAYFSLRQQEIFPYQTQDKIAILEIIKESDHTDRTQRFSSDELANKKNMLLILMDEKRPYLDPNLGLPQLALETDLSTHDLSFVINEGFGENFFQFVSRYRVAEAQRLLLSPKHKHLNILGIAYECGFRSKSTFNTTFKKITGLSPSQFIQSTTSGSADATISTRRMMG